MDSSDAGTDLQHGEIITLSGSSFGNKATAAPLKYDDFQGGSVGQVLNPGSSPQWETWSNNQPANDPTANYPKYASVPQPRFSGDQALRQHFYYTSNGYVSNVSLILRNIRQKVYVSGWTWHDRSDDNTQGLRNVKIWQHNVGEWQSPTSRWDVYPVNGSGHFTSEYCNPSDYVANEWTTSMPSKGQWHRLEIWHNRGSASEQESFKTWVDFHLEGQYTIPYSSCDQDSLYLMSYADQNGNGAEFLDWYWGELYIDTTLARVELGNNPSFAASTHREIQIPTAWSNGSISIKVNKGSFPAGTAYLFVIDENGNPSAGYPVQIGN